MKATLIVVLATAILLPSVHAQTASTSKGNLILTLANGRRVQLTASGRDSSPVFSLDKKRLVFVRAKPGHTQAGTQSASALWLLDIATQKATPLVMEKLTRKPETILSDFQAPQFSPDGKRVYFISAAWATSGAVHAVDVATKAVSFVCAANDLEVVPRGECKGHLIVQQHR